MEDIYKFLILISCMTILIIAVTFGFIDLVASDNTIDKMKNAIINNENITCKEYLKQIEGE